MEEAKENSRVDILNLISLHSNWTPDEAFYELAVKSAVTADCSRSYYYNSGEFKILTGENFTYLWEQLPEARDALLSQVLRCNSDDIPGLTPSVKAFIINKIYNSISVDLEIESNRLRAEISRSITDFDYLSEISRHGLTDQSVRTYRMWESVGSSTSEDPSFYNYLWNRISRKKGAVSERNSIIRKASDRNAVSPDILAHVAKRGTKTMKRTLINNFVARVNQLRYPFGYWTKERDLNPAQLIILNDNKKEIAKIEQRLMLFLDTGDYEVVEGLMGVFSKNNLPWLIPAASQHPNLSRRLNKIIEELE